MNGQPDVGSACFAAVVVMFFGIQFARGCAWGSADDGYRYTDGGIGRPIDAAPADVQPWPDVVEEPLPMIDGTPDPAGTVLEWPAPPCDPNAEPCLPGKLPAHR